MDIASISMNMSYARSAQSVNVTMMKKALDQMEQTGAQIAEMVQNTEVPAQGSIDIKI